MKIVWINNVSKLVQGHGKVSKGDTLEVDDALGCQLISQKLANPAGLDTAPSTPSKAERHSEHLGRRKRHR